MLTFRRASIIMIIMVAAVLPLMVIIKGLAWLLLPLTVTYVALLVIGSVRICSGFYLRAFCRANTDEKIATLSFDDGPDPVNTSKILAILDKFGVRATFFVTGEKAAKNPELLRMIHLKGHLLGNHSFSHSFFFDLFGRKKMEQDLLKTDQLIEKITGTKNKIFRPPYGVTNPTVARTVKKLDYSVIGWSVRSLDTVKNDENEIIHRIKRKLQPGAVILMHDDREMAVKVLERLILKVKDEGYRFVDLEQMRIL